jgi:hypothetical protein
VCVCVCVCNNVCVYMCARYDLFVLPKGVFDLPLDLLPPLPLGFFELDLEADDLALLAPLM